MARIGGRRRIPRLAVGIGLAAWILAPVAALGLLTLQVQSTQLVSAEAAWAPVRAAEGTTSRTTEISLTWDGGTEVAAPNWSGIVQASYIKIGEPIGSGADVALIDGVRRVAWAFEVPLFRSLRVGDSGADAHAANAMLAAAGVEHGTESTFTEASLRGAKTLAASLGVDARAVESLDPAWFVYIPTEGQIVTEDLLVVGAPAPGLGSPVLRQASKIVHAQIPDDSALVAGEILTAGGSDVPVEEVTLTIGADGLSALAAFAEQDADVITAIIRSPAEGSWAVPAAAVITDSTGNTCVVSRSSSGEHGPVEVVVRGAQDGSSLVDASLSGEDEVAVGLRGSARRCE